MIHLLRSQTRRQIRNRQQKLNLSSQNAGAGFVSFFIRNAAGVALYQDPRLMLPLSQEVQTSYFFCMRGWLHRYRRQNVVLLLWTELPKYCLSPPFPELPASIKDMDNNPRRFFSKDLKMSVYQERQSFTKMPIWNGVVTNLQVWKLRQKIGVLECVHHATTQSNAISGEGIPGACASISRKCCSQVPNQKSCWCALKLKSSLH